MEAYGRFIKKNGEVFRTAAELKWGNSDQLLGIFVLMNPGSAKLKLVADEQRLQEEKGEVIGELVIDPAMRQMEKIVHGLYDGNKLEGKVLIHNLFSLREPKSEVALNKFGKLWEQQEPLIKQLSCNREELKQQVQTAGWLLFGWGLSCADNLNLREHIYEWHKIACETGTMVLGKKDRSDYRYFYVRPQLVAEQEKYCLYIANQYKELSRLR